MGSIPKSPLTGGGGAEMLVCILALLNKPLTAETRGCRQETSDCRQHPVHPCHVVSTALSVPGRPMIPAPGLRLHAAAPVLQASPSHTQCLPVADTQPTIYSLHYTTRHIHTYDYGPAKLRDSIQFEGHEPIRKFSNRQCLPIARRSQATQTINGA